MGERTKFGAIGALLMFVILFVAELSLGTYLSYFRDYIVSDAVSRVANASYVLYSRDPHLGAIGFVWNPLPSLLFLIPLLLRPLIPAVAAAGLAANILTSLFSAGLAVMLFRCTLSATGSKFLSILLPLGYALNPFIFLYGANGMSEALFTFFIAWIVIAFTRWMRSDRPIHTIAIGFALALAFWIRYESVAFGAALALGFLAVALSRQNQGMSNRLESTLIVTLTPAIFSGLTWVGLNFLMMGDPLFFFHSGYSNTSFVGDLTADFYRTISSPTGALGLVLRKSIYFSIPLAAILCIRFMTRRWWQWDTLVLVMLAASIPAMQYVMLLKGSSFGWLRFFVYPYTIAVAWLPYELSQIRFLRFYKTCVSLLCVSVLLSSFVVLNMNNLAMSPEEYGVFHIEESGAQHELQMSQEVARYADELFRSESNGENIQIITDSFSAFMVLLNSRYPKHWVITNDRDFEEMLKDPYAHGIQYILVSKKKGAVLQVIHEAYPELFDHGEPWAQLVKDFDGEWKLFRITANVNH